MKTLLYIFICIAGITLFSQCKKDNDGKQASKCNIRIINYFGTVYAYTFDNQGRILTMNTDTDPTWNPDYTYTYTNDSCILIARRENRLWKKTTAVLNARGLPVSSITAEFNYLLDNPIPYPDSLRITYEYDDDGKLVKMTSKKDNAPAEIISYNWSNGNLVSDSRGVNYSYYHDQPSQNGDYLSFQELWPNIQDPNPKLVFNKSKNLLKSAGAGANELEFRYEKNTDGNIVVINDAIIIGYACH